LKESYLQSAELLARCYEASDKWQEYFQLVQQLAPTLHFYIGSLSHFERMLKVLLLPSFYSITRKHHSSLNLILELLSDLPDRGYGPNEGFLLLKGRVSERIFP
jgi:hypothetical protein